MLDIKRIRTNPEEIKAAMKNRGEDFDDSIIDEVVSLDEKRRNILSEVEAFKSKRNSESAQIAKMKKAGEDTSSVTAEMKKLSDQIKEYDVELAKVDEKIQYDMLRIPNIPHSSVPEGKSDADNVEIRKWGEPTKFNFQAKAHWDLGTNLNILDFERASKVSGSRFTFYRGLGARLERAIITFFLDTHTEKHGYEEILPPYFNIIFNCCCKSKITLAYSNYPVWQSKNLKNIFSISCKLF